MKGKLINGPWFFMPASEDDRAHGSVLANFRGYPMMYSPGFATQQEALDAADEWEIVRNNNDRQMQEWKSTFKEVSL